MPEYVQTRPRLRFWFEFASSYTYFAAHRIEALADWAGIDIEWCPFLLGPIFAARGWQTSPFEVYPDKGRHMWRDMERRAALHGLPFRKPSRFPQSGLLAARVTLAGLGEAWMPGFVKAVFAAHFVRDADIADRAVLGELIEHCGGDPAGALAASGAPEIKADLRRRTEEAAGLGIFGAPSFIADGELFWGDDRLEEAIAWCAGSHPGRSDPAGR